MFLLVGLGVRAILPGGNSSPAKSASISFLTVSTLGNTQDFGDLTQDRKDFKDLQVERGHLV